MTELSEGGRWKLEAGHSYYVVRGMSSIIAFTMPQTSEYKGYNIVASHSDSPSFKIKENPQMPGDSHYVSLNVEKYGGMIMSTWLDRPLSVAGRAVVADDEGVKEYLVNADKDLVVIPNLAIHMNRNINDGNTFNAQKDMIPVFGDENAKDKFDDYIRSQISAVSGTQSANIDNGADVTTELFLYNRERGTIWGYNDEFMIYSVPTRLSKHL